MKIRNMTAGRPAGLILSVALPLMLGNVFQQMYTVVDTAVVGNVLGVTALAALGASDWFNWMFLSIMQGFAQGFSIPIAQEFGADNPEALRRNIASAIRQAAILAVVLCAIALLSITPVLAYALKTPPEILPISRQYLTILFAGTPIVMTYNLMAGILRSLGDGKSPLIAMVIASILNVCLDLLFVMVFHWGVAGAAIATLIGQFCSCIFCFARLRGIEIIRLTRADFAPERAVTSRLIRLSVPLAAQNAIISIGGMILQSVVNGMGVLFIAGYTATNKLYGMLEVAATSFGYAITTYVGQNLGAGRIDRIRSGMRSGLVMNVITSALIGALMLIFGRQIVGIFISGEPEQVVQSVEIAYEFLSIMSIFLPVLYILYVYRSALQGLGDTVMPMASGIAEFIMRTGSALLLPALIGYRGIFIAEVLAWAGADAILIVSYYRRFHRLTAAAQAPSQDMA